MEAARAASVAQGEPQAARRSAAGFAARPAPAPADRRGTEWVAARRRARGVRRPPAPARGRSGCAAAFLLRTLAARRSVERGAQRHRRAGARWRDGLRAGCGVEGMRSVRDRSAHLSLARAAHASVRARTDEVAVRAAARPFIRRGDGRGDRRLRYTKLPATTQPL